MTSALAHRRSRHSAVDADHRWRDSSLGKSIGVTLIANRVPSRTRRLQRITDAVSVVTRRCAASLDHSS